MTVPQIRRLSAAFRVAVVVAPFWLAAVSGGCDTAAKPGARPLATGAADAGVGPGASAGAVDGSATAADGGDDPGPATRDRPDATADASGIGALDGATDGGAIDGSREGGLDAPDAGGDGAPDAAPPACSPGPCPPDTLVDDGHQITTLLLDDHAMYFACEGDDSIRSCSKVGCPEGSAVLAHASSVGLVLHEGVLYFPDFATNRLLSCPVTGCPDGPTVLLLDERQARAIAFDGERLYWHAGGNDGTIRSCDPAHCRATVRDVATGQGWIDGLDAAPGHLLWTSRGAAVRTLDTRTAGALPVPLVRGSSANVALHGTDAIFDRGRPGRVVRCDLGGCNEQPTMLLGLGDFDTVTKFLADGDQLWVRDEFWMKLYRCPLSGCTGSPEVFATRVPRSSGFASLAADETYLYVPTTSEILRFRK